MGRKPSEREPTPSHADTQHLYTKYTVLPKYVDGLEPAAVAQMFKAGLAAGTGAGHGSGTATKAHVFFPSWGLFFNEFTLGYCFNLHQGK